MKQSDQIKLLIGQYSVGGAEVFHDVRIGQIKNLENRDRLLKYDIKADIVVDYKGGGESVGLARPHLLIVEIANRDRVGWPSPDTELYNKKAGDRFEDLQRIVLENNDVFSDIEIRFLDGSADRFRARKMKGATARNWNALEAEIEIALSQIESLNKSDPGIQDAVLGRIWARWLRILSYRFPGWRRKEMKEADLSTIQSDLYAHNIISLTPKDYKIINQNLMAIAEGGDVDWNQIRKLSSEMQKILAFAKERLVRVSDRG
ncbi:hypothetical protein [Azospirillum lipoferum]|uniref:Uncharacterized protein n=1 Tax=Azospirillum lipoferum (strain 4B) TaxID=862719 RepID=G7Z1Q1_AZOL4|nr:hypothetical protein [Azospirillum lipoferum]CBS87184.1 protein of unknown function; putative coiled-coil domain [Azospirillum lipoferum 4B]